MINSIKSRTAALALILFVFAIGYTFAANRVVVVPLLGANEVPSGMVSAFNSDECPAGWSKYSGAQGRFVVGLVDSGTLGYQHGTALSDRGSQVHNHNWGYFYGFGKSWHTYNSDGGYQTILDWSDGMDNVGSGYYPLAADDTFPGSSTHYYTTRNAHIPPYVQLLYCEKT